MGWAAGVIESAAVEIQFFVATDVGRQRKQNEDNYLVDPEMRLFVVADGMGGHAAGEVASQIAVHAMSGALRENRDLLERYRAGERENVVEARQEILAVLEHAVQAACAAVFKAGQEDDAKRGMGTTTVALLLAGDRGFIAHVGDSRIYLVRQNQVHQITEDHSLINELVKRGKLKREEFETSPYAKYKNAVTRAIGANESVEVDTLDFDVLPGDRFLLCSDGLHAYLDNPTLVQLLGADDKMPESAKNLVALANAGGGHDNITALVVSVVEKSSQEAVERVSDLTNKVEVLESLTLFRNLSYKEIIRILNRTEVRNFAPGERIIEEGAPGEELFVILGGKVRLHKGNAFITHLERGAHLGEMALVDRSPRSASATAEEQTKMLLLRRREFYEVLRKEPALATKLLWSFLQVLSDRLRKTTAELSGARLEAQAEELSSDALFDDEA